MNLEIVLIALVLIATALIYWSLLKFEKSLDARVNAASKDAALRHDLLLVQIEALRIEQQQKVERLMQQLAESQERNYSLVQTVASSISEGVNLLYKQASDNAEAAVTRITRNSEEMSSSFDVYRTFATSSFESIDQRIRERSADTQNALLELSKKLEDAITI